YHNHFTEFVALDGQGGSDYHATAFDVLCERTDPRYVALQMDVCWATRGGGDPAGIIRKFPTRFRMLHIKDITGPPAWEQTDLGKGSIDFAKILRADLDAKHVVEHVFVEHDQPKDPMLFAKNAYDYLSKLEY